MEEDLNQGRRDFKYRAQNTRPRGLLQVYIFLFWWRDKFNVNSFFASQRKTTTKCGLLETTVQWKDLFIVVLNC